jgi:uncharacterized protein (TIGR00266 family)
VKIDVREQGVFSVAVVHLSPGEEFVSEAGALYRSSSNVDIDVTTKSHGQGGLLSGLKRMLAGNTFFFSTYRVLDSQPGEVGLAPTHLGSVHRIDVTPEQGWLCTGGSYLGSGAEVALDTEFQGLRGFVSGESLMFVKARGTGPLLVSAFGQMSQLEVTDSLIVDSGHLVAFTEGLTYTIDKVGGGWMQTFLTGEGFVMKFSGRGKVILQSHNPDRLGKYLGPKLPERE